jgi:hypothetical protein
LIRLGVAAEIDGADLHGRVQNARSCV